MAPCVKVYSLEGVRQWLRVLSVHLGVLGLSCGAQGLHSAMWDLPSLEGVRQWLRVLSVHLGVLDLRCSTQDLHSAMWGLSVQLSGCSTGQLLHSVVDLSSPTRGQTCVPCVARQILSHWTTGEAPFLKRERRS